MDISTSKIDAKTKYLAYNSAIFNISNLNFLYFHIYRDIYRTKFICVYLFFSCSMVRASVASRCAVEAVRPNSSMLDLSRLSI